MISEIDTVVRLAVAALLGSLSEADIRAGAGRLKEQPGVHSVKVSRKEARDRAG